MASKFHLLFLSAIAVFAFLALWIGSGYAPRTLYFDDNGIAHGTGTREYFYKSGELKLVDRYVAGQCVEETWYKPDGTVIANEHFVDGTGTGYYLYEDGTIKLKMTYVKGLAHGPARFFPLTVKL